MCAEGTEIARKKINTDKLKKEVAEVEMKRTHVQKRYSEIEEFHGALSFADFTGADL